MDTFDGFSSDSAAHIDELREENEELKSRLRDLVKHYHVDDLEKQTLVLLECRATLRDLVEHFDGDEEFGARSIIAKARSLYA